jgi:hypothetical protein
VIDYCLCPENRFVSKATYWTGGTTQGCSGKFTWCPSNNPLNAYLQWQLAQPSLKKGEDCVILQYNSGSFGNGLDDTQCDKKESFICKVSIK